MEELTPEQRAILMSFIGNTYSQAKQLDNNIVTASSGVTPISDIIANEMRKVVERPRQVYTPPSYTPPPSPPEYHIPAQPPSNFYVSQSKSVDFTDLVDILTKVLKKVDYLLDRQMPASTVAARDNTTTNVLLTEKDNTFEEDIHRS